MNNTELLPCPFCGGEAKEMRETSLIKFGCDKCAVKPHSYYQVSFPDWRDDAISEWNTRADKAAPVGDVDLDNAREVFEKWITANGYYPHLKHKSFGGNYLHEEVAMKWDGFRAGYYTQPKQSAPMERIEGLNAEAIKSVEYRYNNGYRISEDAIDPVLEAARAYLKLQGGE